MGTKREGEGIIVQTREGNNIENFRGPQPGVMCRTKFDRLRKVYGANWATRKEVSGGYNCAGLVWASRRVALSDPNDWERILKEDGYRRLKENQAAEVGDVVVYRKKGSTEIMHVARLCDFRAITDTSGSELSRPAPRALSKWDLTSGESIHGLSDVFLNGGEDFDLEIFTDRVVEIAS